MQRIATVTAVVVVASAAAVAFTGALAPAPLAVDSIGTASAGDASLDRTSAGILAGAFVGASVALLSHTLVAIGLKQDTEAAFKALVVGFLAKCLGAILPWGALTFLPQVGRLADPTAYLIAFAAVVVLVLGGGLFDHLRAVARSGSDRSSAEVSGGPASEAGSAGASDGIARRVHGAADESQTEIAFDSSDQRSGSASSSPRKPAGASLTKRTAGAVSSPVHPLGSSDSLESAT